MVYISRINNDAFVASKPNVTLRPTQPFNQVSQPPAAEPIDRVSLNELVEMAEEYLECHKKLKEAKSYQKTIWGQHTYFAKPLGNTILERERMHANAHRIIAALTKRIEDIEFYLHSNRDAVLNEVSPEILRKRLGDYNKTTSEPLPGFNTATLENLKVLREKILKTCEVVGRKVLSYVSNALAPDDSIRYEYKRRFLGEASPATSAHLANLVIENKRLQLHRAYSQAG